MDPTDQPNSDQPNSICHVQAIQMYQLPPSDPSIVLPFKLLNGEAVSRSGRTEDGAIILTNYRLYLQTRHNPHYHLPLGLIENLENRDGCYLHILLKDGKTYRCTFDNNEICLEWIEWLSRATEPPRQLDQMFPFYHYIWTKHKGGDDVVEKMSNLKVYAFGHDLFKNEMERLQFEGDAWRITEANKDFKLCPTYPPYLIVPSCVNDATLETVAKFRSSRRIPAVVWRHTENGAVIARCSQPEIGWLGWRSSDDEDFIKAISQACSFDQRNNKDATLSHSSSSHHSAESLQQIPTEIAGPSSQGRKFLIMDARSYSAAIANRARGGGSECHEYYLNSEIQYMNLPNIHVIRKSFHGLRALCGSAPDQLSWFSQLEKTQWLQHMSGLIGAAVTLANAVEVQARPVMVHCSDGWDRTPQIVALAELLLDPYYRTIDGFRILIEREWLAFGHKFADRCGHSLNDDSNERSPVFLQWLDCVHQLLIQFDCAFEFSQSYLVKLAQHVYSNLYGTFLCNTFQDRMEMVNGKTLSVWQFLDSPRFRNHLYAPPSSTHGNKYLVPDCNVRDLHVWRELYLGSSTSNSTPSGGATQRNNPSTVETSSGSCPGPPPPPPGASPSHMTKTRSYGDLLNASEGGPSQLRRSSDPSINIDKNMVVVMSSVVVSKNCDANNGSAFLSEVGEIASLYNKNGEVVRDNGTSEVTCNGGEDEDDNEKSESRSENTVYEVETKDTLDTSTDTLVSDGHNISSSPAESNGFEKVQAPSETASDVPHRLCAQNLKLVNEAASNGIQFKYCTGTSSASPMFSRASSCSGWETGVSPTTHHKHWHNLEHPYSLGDDGLVPITSIAQERLWQIIQEHRRKEELLEKELHTYRQALLRQSCHKCSNDNEKIDDTGSVVESVCSAGEGQASAVESLRSDLSWEAVEENGLLTECTATLWVPDHAVTRCTGCQTEFWVGKRKHHCRNCGRIFCGSCSENTTPLPAEHLYTPVRVCIACYAKLRRDFPEQCKQGHPQPTTSNPQIAASSN